MSKKGVKKIFPHLNLSKIVWIFTLGCFLGWVFETLFYYFKYGTFLNKQGLLYGPFKPIYGLGAIILSTLAERPLKGRNIFVVFIVGVVFGALYEYACYMFQVYVFGTFTWTYEGFKYTITNAVYVPYALVWGLITVVWVRIIYKPLQKVLTKITRQKFKWVAFLLGIFMIANLLLTAAAVNRKAERYNNISPSNKFEELVDKYYDDEYMDKKLPKVRIIK